MRAVFIEKHGDCDVLRVRETPTPTPAAGQVAIAVRAAGINFADLLAREGIYPPAPPPPCVVGYEVAGIVTAVGAGVDSAWKGREVIAMPHFGGYAEIVCVDVAHVWDKPAGLSFELAAAIPENYVTAWALLMGLGGLKRGETVLIHNAGGGVGLAAIDIARHVGATLVGTASTGKHAFLRSRGCPICIDYAAPDWPDQVRDASGGGVHLAIDPIGGANWKKSFSVLRAGGRLGMFGISGASKGGKLGLLKLALSMPFFHPLQLMPRNRGVFGVQMHEMYANEIDTFRAWMGEVLRGVADGWIRPHVDRVFSFAEAPAAHAHIEARKNLGKVILVP